MSSKNKTDKTNPPAPEVVQIDHNTVPVLNEASFNFIKNLVSKSDFRFLEFDDNLEIYSLSGNSIGKFQLTVKNELYRNFNCFKVVAHSDALLDDSPCSTEIFAYVNENLDTIEQEYHEKIKLPKYVLDKQVNIVLNNTNDEYTITKTEKFQTEVKKQTYKINKTLMKGFVSESSNIILQRLMIQNKIIDSFNLFTFDSDINPCLVSYSKLGSRVVKIEDEEYNIQGIERTIEAISDIPVTWQIYFSSDGHMVNRVQVGYPAVMKITEKPKPIEIDEYLEKPEIPRKRIDWEKDMEMKSKYLYRKDELKNNYDHYLNEHPELKALMASYMQSVLTYKPTDLITFSAKFFAPYHKKVKPNPLYPSLNQTTNVPKF